MLVAPAGNQCGSLKGEPAPYWSKPPAPLAQLDPGVQSARMSEGQFSTGITKIWNFKERRLVTFVRLDSKIPPASISIDITQLENYMKKFNITKKV